MIQVIPVLYLVVGTFDI